MTLLSSMLRALLLTELLEVGLSLLLGLRREKLTLVLLMNIMTNPAANLLHYILVFLLGLPRAPVVLLLEAAVVVAEGLCCRELVRRPWLFALAVNGFSYGIGLLLQTIL